MVINMEQKAESMNQLITCAACGNSIAPLAASCPKCGAPNDWQHPDIKAFLDGAPRLAVSRPCYFWNSKNEVWGETRVRYAWWAWLISALVLIIAVGYATIFSGSVLSFFGSLLAASVVAAVVMKGAAIKDTFRADLVRRTWSSTNDVFWQPVKASLKV